MKRVKESISILMSLAMAAAVLLPVGSVHAESIYSVPAEATVITSDTAYGVDSIAFVKADWGLYYYITGSESIDSFQSPYIGVTYGDGQWDPDHRAQAVMLDGNYSQVIDGNGNAIEGSSIQTKWDDAENRRVTVAYIPAGAFQNSEVKLSISGYGDLETTAIAMGEVGRDADDEAPAQEETNGTPEELGEPTSTEPEPAEPTPAEPAPVPEADPVQPPAPTGPYTGISMDGDFSDWDSVPKVNPNEEKISEAAMVFDGAYVYIYLNAPKNYFAQNSGEMMNGNFAITTDLGYTLPIQLTQVNNGMLNGVAGATVNRSDDTWGQDRYLWEISIPASELPNYLNTISFGLNQGEVFVSDIANINPLPTDDKKKEFNGISFDGNYEDWDYYPHTVLEYSTAGSSATVPDAEGALYSADGAIFGHVVSSYHSGERGNEYTEGITIRFNQDSNLEFYPRLVAVDGAGNINWNPKRTDLELGTYEFYIVSRDAWGATGNISEFDKTYPADQSWKNMQLDADKIYGKMQITVGPSKDETEFMLDSELVAKKLGISTTDMKTLEAQFLRVGDEWIVTAGTSTNPLLGIAICLAVVGVSGYYGKRKGWNLR